MRLQGFQRVSDNIDNDAPAMRERFEAIVKACAKTASLDSSFQESEIAAANGHSNASPETKVCIWHCTATIINTITTHLHRTLLCLAG